MIEIMLNEIEKMYGGNKILTGATFQIMTGERVGLVGRNGAGKTTLFKLISGIDKCDNGNLTIRKGASIGYLDQFIDVPENYKVMDVLHMAFAEQFAIYRSIEELARQMEKLGGDEPEYDSILRKYGALQQLYEQKQGFDIAEKVQKLCSGLKIAADFLEREFRTLSGGEKTTAIMGRVLLQNPDILLLDEPTNHLDVESIEWLEEFLTKYKGTVMIVSHDRYFLDRVINKTIEVENGKTEVYSGNYSDFCREKEQKMLGLSKQYAQQQTKIKQLTKAAHDLREWGKQADNPGLHKRAENIEKRLEKMEKIEKPLQEHSIGLAFANTDLASKDVIRATNVTKAFGPKIILDNLNLHVRYREKIALLGQNGVGKSTLLKVLMGEYLPDNGEVVIGSGTKLGYVEQNISFSREENTVLEEFRTNTSVAAGEARKILAKFLFRGEDVFKKVKTLSGGEKSRLRLCQLMQQHVNFLVLDEPTNHLDINSMEVLEKALTEFEGTILFISHDRYFISQIADRIVELKAGHLTSYPGNYQYYKEKRTEAKLRPRKPEQDNTLKEGMRQSSKKAAREQPKNKRPDNATECRITDLELKIQEKTDEMETCNTDFMRLATMYEERSVLEKELERLMNEWLRLS